MIPPHGGLKKVSPSKEIKFLKQTSKCTFFCSLASFEVILTFLSQLSFKVKLALFINENQNAELRCFKTKEFGE